MAGKTRFSKIAGVVGGQGGHELRRRKNRASEDRDDRLKELGVRKPKNSQTQDLIPREAQQMYDQAYNALKQSGKSWATENEVKSILFGDKEMSRERSAEVIEELRKAGVKGFKETDEVTSGDVYSERMLNTLGRAQKSQERKDRHETIQKVKDRDKRSIMPSDMDIDAGSADEGPDSEMITKLAPLTGSKTQNAPFYSGKPKERKFKDDQKPYSIPPVKPEQKEKAEDEKDKDDDNKKEIPLSYDLSDF